MASKTTYCHGDHVCHAKAGVGSWRILGMMPGVRIDLKVNVALGESRTPESGDEERVLSDARREKKKMRSGVARGAELCKVDPVRERGSLDASLSDFRKCYTLARKVRIRSRTCSLYPLATFFCPQERAILYLLTALRIRPIWICWYAEFMADLHLI